MNIPNYTYRPITVSSLFTAHNSQAENYAFASKERDTETGLSVTSLRSVSSLPLGHFRTSSNGTRWLRRFGARYYSSELSIWLSVDPMVDKYPSFSPYVYCANNPVKLVDPNGEDIIDVDQATGKITITQQEGNDILRCGKNEVTLSDNGVFKKAHNGVVREGTLLVGMSKKDSRDVFNFMADNTNVEWGYMETLNDDGSSCFMVGTANDSDGERQVYGMAMAAKEGSVLRYDHSHPKTNKPGTLDWAPSTPKTAANSENVDTGAWNALLKRNPNVSLGIRYSGATLLFFKKGVDTGAYPPISKYIK